MFRYAAAYLLTICSFQLLIGKLYVLYSVKWVFLGALGFFELGSLISGVAPNSTALTFGRAVAGVGAAGLFSGAFLIIAQAVPLRQRPAYIGFVGAMFTIASVAGPLLGGVFTSRLTWRWCFYINLPFGGVTALFIVVFFKSYGKGQDGVGWKQQIFQLDLEGTVCFLPGIISLLLALQWGGTKYPWSNGRIIGLFVVFAVLVIAFVLIQVWKQERATVPPRIFLNRNVWGCAIFGACFGASFFLLIYYVSQRFFPFSFSSLSTSSARIIRLIALPQIPIWFQAIKGVSAFRSGIMNLPSILGVVVMSMIVGGATTAIGYYTPFIYASSVIMSVGAGLLTTFTVDTTSARWIGYQIIYGLGAGMGMQQPLIAIQATLSAQDIAIGTAIFVFAETAGGAIFIAVGQNIFTNQLMKHVVAANIPQLDPALILQTGATQLRSLVPPQYLRPLLVAYNKAVIRTWYVVVGMAALSIVGAFFMEWKSVKGKKVNELMTTA